jgi:hypothetical protein
MYDDLTWLPDVLSSASLTCLYFVTVKSIYVGCVLDV